ncbi:hypothetical protein [Parasitella parasitica]|uniref:GATA-type domain-containing protein n=1 Tax=Parasitella parasitica TaxID=35722 RepID=A0A0B7NF46_9FUNG|nr:hypothetical protein [Parasitella parasitica]
MPLEYFPPTHFADNSVVPVEDTTAYYDEEASPSATSISPLGSISLRYPHSMNHVYYAHDIPPVFMRAYGYYGDPSYSHTYPNQEPMIHSSSMSSEDQLLLQNEELVANTLSPTSTLSSASYTTTTNSYLNNAQDFLFFNKPIVQDDVEHTVIPPASGDTSHFKKRAANTQSAFSQQSSLANTSTSVANHVYKQSSETRKTEYTYKHQANSNSQCQYEKTDLKKTHHVKKPTRSKGKKKCYNCHTIESPSWRRSINKSSKGELVCNACGLYEKTAKTKRMLVTNDDGTTKVVRKRDPRGFCCSRCGAKDSTRWRKFRDNTFHCEQCVRGRR